MVFVKVRETYDLKTTENKMTVIAIHTPKPDIIKRSYPGLLMQCKMYRPYSCDVRIACASVLPLDPQGIGTEPGDVAPEDVFNPILYKAMSNKGMSQLEARINALAHYPPVSADVDGQSSLVEVDDVTSVADEFDIYYGLLANTHEWKHANPQSGLSMTNLRPLVYDVLYNVGDQNNMFTYNPSYDAPNYSGTKQTYGAAAVLGNAHPMPFINCTSFTFDSTKDPATSICPPGFVDTDNKMPYNAEQKVPWLNVVVGTIITPPSRLHTLYYRMVVEWTLEFSSIRQISEIGDYGGLGRVGDTTHYQNYSYETTKAALTGDSSSILDNSACMVDANVGIKKVM